MKCRRCRKRIGFIQWLFTIDNDTIKGACAECFLKEKIERRKRKKSEGGEE